MELLALRWQDVDFANGYIHVRWQLSRKGGLKELKTESGRRDVVLMPELARLLRRHKAASRYSTEGDFVFASAVGTPLNWRNVETRGFDEAVARAKLSRTDGKPVLHDCRHTFASLLIAQGLDVVFISRQLGHANPATTFRIYAHLFDRVNHAARMREALSTGFGSLLKAAASRTAHVGEARSSTAAAPRPPTDGLYDCGWARPGSAPRPPARARYRGVPPPQAGAELREGAEQHVHLVQRVLHANSESSSNSRLIRSEQSAVS